MNDHIELLQRSFPAKRLRLTVMGNRELSLAQNGMFRSTQLQFPLEQLSADPIHVREIPFGWVVVSAIACFLTMAALWNWLSSQESGALFGVILLSGIAIGCIYNTWQLSRNLLIYRNAATGNHLFAISRNSPSVKQVDQFVQKLKERIESFRSPKGIAPDELIGLYKRHLQYLLSEGVLLPEENAIIERRLDAKPSQNNVLEIVR